MNNIGVVVNAKQLRKCLRDATRGNEDRTVHDSDETISIAVDGEAMSILDATRQREYSIRCYPYNTCWRTAIHAVSAKSFADGLEDLMISGEGAVVVRITDNGSLNIFPIENPVLGSLGAVGTYND